MSWLPELPDDDELGRSLGSLALRLLVKACGAVEVSEPESKLAEPSSRPHLLALAKTTGIKIYEPFSRKVVYISILVFSGVIYFVNM